MKTYKLVVKNFCKSKDKPIRLNDIIDGRMYNFRTKKYHNAVKTKGDYICSKAIREQLKGLKIKESCVITYYFYAKDEWDSDGVISAFWKCFLDALQKCNVVQNDTYKYVGAPILLGYEIDRKNPRVEIMIIEKEKGENIKADIKLIKVDQKG